MACFAALRRLEMDLAHGPRILDSHAALAALTVWYLLGREFLSATCLPDVRSKSGTRSVRDRERGGRRHEWGGRARKRHYGLGKRQKGVNEDIETGNDLVGGFKAEPASSRIFKALDSPLRLDRISSGWTFKKAFVCLIR